MVSRSYWSSSRGLDGRAGSDKDQGVPGNIWARRTVGLNSSLLIVEVCRQTICTWNNENKWVFPFCLIFFSYDASWLLLSLIYWLIKPWIRKQNYQSDIKLTYKKHTCKRTRHQHHLPSPPKSWRDISKAFLFRIVPPSRFVVGLGCVHFLYYVWRAEGEGRKEGQYISIYAVIYGVATVMQWRLYSD